jgi:hypothetical protein
LIIECDSGVLVSGGVSIAEVVTNAAIVKDLPIPASGTPIAWNGEIVNVSGQDVTMIVSIICTTPAATSSGAATPTQGARIVKRSVAKLRTTAKA